MARALIGGCGLYIENLETKEAQLELKGPKRFDVSLKTILFFGALGIVLIVALLILTH